MWPLLPSQLRPFSCNNAVQSYICYIFIESFSIRSIYEMKFVYDRRDIVFPSNEIFTLKKRKYIIPSKITGTYFTQYVLRHHHGMYRFTKQYLSKKIQSISINIGKYVNSYFSIGFKFQARVRFPHRIQFCLGQTTSNMTTHPYRSSSSITGKGRLLGNSIKSNKGWQNNVEKYVRVLSTDKVRFREIDTKF